MIKIVDEVVKEHENLIYKLASSFNQSYKEDLYQVGVIGLIEAYNNYNPKYNVKFSTYAYPFILGEMKRFISLLSLYLYASRKNALAAIFLMAAFRIGWSVMHTAGKVNMEITGGFFYPFFRRFRNI